MKHLKTILALLVCITSANAQWWSGGTKKINGNGNVIVEKRSVSDYNSINVAGSMNVKLVPGTEGNLVVEAEENLMKYLITEVKGDVLSVKIESGYNISTSMNKKFKVTVPYKDIEKIALSGSGKIFTNEVIKANKFSTSLSGSGDVNLLLDTQKTYASVTGSGDIRLKGKTQEIECEVTGSGDLHASEFKAKEGFANVTGSGDIKLYVDDFIKARVTGSGDIHYLGNPEREDKKVTGSGGITSR